MVNMNWEHELWILQSELAWKDLEESMEARATNSIRPYMVAQLQQMKLKMYQERGHKTPHLHVDYGTTIHAGSYGIDPAKVIAGGLGRRQDRAVLAWIESHKAHLLEIWVHLQAGREWTVRVEEPKRDDDVDVSDIMDLSE